MGLSSPETKTGNKKAQQEPYESNKDECQVLNLGRRATGTNTSWGVTCLGALLKIQVLEALMVQQAVRERAICSGGEEETSTYKGVQ